MNLAQELEGLLGKNATQQEVSVWLDTGFKPLNKAISGRYDGGLPGGRMVEMFGGSSCGKTAIATCVMAAAQRRGGIAAFNDHEHSFDVGQAQGVGLDPNGAWVYKQPETFEESVDDMVKLARGVRSKKLIAPEAPIVAVFDSLASMVPQSKLYDSKGNEKGAGDLSMHDNLALAKCTSSAFPALAQMASKYNMMLLFLNQTRTKPGVMYGDPTTTPGGNAPEYYASVRIQLTRSMLKDKKEGTIDGQDIKAFLKKNKVSAPYKEANWRFLFREDGSGYFDTVYSTLDYMKSIGLLTLSGNYIEWEGKKYYQQQLADKIQAEGRLADLENMLLALDPK
jgi:protein RecA